MALETQARQRWLESLPELATIAANGGTTKATADIAIAAGSEYR